jgi:muramidase (phage lysozyme)
VAITGEGYSNLKDILRVIAMVLESDAQNSAATANSTQIAIDESLPTLLAHPHTVQRMKVILKHLSSPAAGISAQLLQEAYSDLTPELQTVLSESSAL